MNQPQTQNPLQRQRQQAAIQARMEKERIQSGLLNPVRTVEHYDDLTGKFTIQRIEDLTTHLDGVRQDRIDNPDGFTDGRLGRKIGSIPMTLAHKWLVEDGFDCLDPNNAKAVKRKLNEFSKLRTVDKML